MQISVGRSNIFFLLPNISNLLIWLLLYQIEMIFRLRNQTFNSFLMMVSYDLTTFYEPELTNLKIKTELHKGLEKTLAIPQSPPNEETKVFKWKIWNHQYSIKEFEENFIFVKYLSCINSNTYLSSKIINFVNEYLADFETCVFRGYLWNHLSYKKVI